MAVSLADWRERFPDFDLEASDDRIVVLLDEATRRGYQGWPEADVDSAIGYLVAHWLTVAIEHPGSDGRGIGVASERLGDASVSYDLGADLHSHVGPFSRTYYGLRYLEYLKKWQYPNAIVV